MLGKRRKKQKKKKKVEAGVQKKQLWQQSLVCRSESKKQRKICTLPFELLLTYIYRQGGGGKPGNNLMAGSSSATGRCTTWGKSEKTSTPIAAKRAKERWGFFNLLYVYIFIRLYRTIGKRERKCKKGREKENRKLRATNEEENY